MADPSRVEPPAELALVPWLREREANCRRIAMLKPGGDRPGWWEDAAYFADAVAMIERLEKRVAELEAERQWRPVETCPNETDVLLWWPYWCDHAIVGKRVDEYIGGTTWQSWEAIGANDGPPPRGWLPLPPPPASATERGE